MSSARTSLRDSARRLSETLEGEVANKLLALPYEVVHWRPLQCWLAVVGLVVVLMRLDLTAEVVRRMPHLDIGGNPELASLQAWMEWIGNIAMRCFLRTLFACVAVVGTLEIAHRFFIQCCAATSSEKSSESSSVSNHLDDAGVATGLDQYPGLTSIVVGAIGFSWWLAVCPPPGWQLFFMIWRIGCTVAGGLFLCASVFEQANIYLPMSALCLYISGSDNCRVMLLLDGLAAASNSFQYCQRLYFLHEAKKDFHHRVKQALQMQTFHPVFVGQSFEALVHDSLQSPKARRLAFHLHHAVSFGTRSRMLRENCERLSQSLHMLRNLMDKEEWLLEVERGDLLTSCLKAVQDAPMSKLLSPKMRVSFRGEEGEDEGGLLRDLFDSIGAELTKEASETKLDGASGSASSLLSHLADMGGDCLLRVRGKPRALKPLMVVHPEDQTLVLRAGTDRLDDFYALGRLLGLAVHHRVRLPLHLSRATWKLLTGHEIEANDVFAMDPIFFANRVAAVLEPGGVNAVSDAMCEPLCFVSAIGPLSPEPVELEPGGRQKLVTEENKLEYVKLFCEFYLCGKVQQEWQLVRQGFQDLVPAGMLVDHGICDRDLELLLVGIPTISTEDWRKHTILDGPLATSRQGRILSTWFWEVVEQFGDERRAKLLQFATGSSRLPADGFAHLEPSFRLYLSHGSPDLLPTASTCANQLNLAAYPSKRVLIAKLTRVCDDKNSLGFGFL